MIRRMIETVLPSGSKSGKREVAVICAALMWLMVFYIVIFAEVERIVALAGFATGIVFAVFTLVAAAFGIDAVFKQRPRAETGK